MKRFLLPLALLSLISLAVADRFNEQTAEKRRKSMISRCYLIPVDEEIAIIGARFRHERDWGLGDAIIYATAIREGAKVLTGDPHSKGLEDVIFLGDQLSSNLKECHRNACQDNVKFIHGVK